MSNLITEKQKNIVFRDYLTRLASVILVIISILGVLFLAYVIPYYFSVANNDLKTAEQFEQIIKIENKENVGENNFQIIAKTVEELKVVDWHRLESESPSVSLIKVINNKNNSIRLTRLSVVSVKDKQSQILVNGLAKNRESLVNFISDLKDQAGFLSVESPISDFAKNLDIPFTINIKINS